MRTFPVFEFATADGGAIVITSAPGWIVEWAGNEFQANVRLCGQSRWHIGCTCKGGREAFLQWVRNITDSGVCA